MYFRNITKFIISCFILFGMFSTVNSLAQTTPSTNTITNTSEAKTVETEKFTGEVKRKDQNKLTVTKDDQTKEFTIPNNIKIKRDTVDSSIDKLDVGDTVTVEQIKNNGTIISVDAISNQTTNTLKWAVGIAILLLIASIVAYLINKKANKSHIQTAVFTK